MDKLRILRGFCLGKGVDVYPGDVIDAAIIPPRMIRPYLLAGKLEPIEADDEPAPAKKGGKKNAAS
jgi:hypothetical protein